MSDDASPDCESDLPLSAAIGHMQPTPFTTENDMLDKTHTLFGYRLAGRGGEIGRVKDFYFDDLHWTIRYLVVDTGSWLVDKQVLISPHAFAAVNREERSIGVKLTKQQIEKSPSLESDKPVSRQFEEGYNQYYGWPMYWGGPYSWGSVPCIPLGQALWSQSAQGENAWDPHLRSTHQVSGYHVKATDGEIGHISDFIIDDKTWAIRYLIVDTRNWWPGKRVLIAPQWIESINWPESRVFVNLPRKTIRASPEYTDDSLWTRDYEARLHDHYYHDGCRVEPASGLLPAEVGAQEMHHG